LTIGHTPDVDDGFMLYGLLTGRVDLEGLEFTELVAPISTLNEQALEGALDVTAASVASLPDLARAYDILNSGACMAEDRGPLLVQRAGGPVERIAVPGLSTTAFLVLRCILDKFEPVVMPFDSILQAVSLGEVDAGVLISEDQQLWEGRGLEATDLGKAWNERTGYPLPLGVDLVRRGLDEDLKRCVARVFRRSVEFALGNVEEALDYAMQYARDATREEAETFALTFVGPFTLEMGHRGRVAIGTFLDTCQMAGLVKGDYELNFVKG